MSEMRNGLPQDTIARRVAVIIEVYFAGLAGAQEIDAAKTIAPVIGASDAAAGYTLSLGANIGLDTFGLHVCAEHGTRTDFRRADALAKHLYGLAYKALGDERCGYVYELAKAIRKYDELAGFSLATAGGQQ